jgi:PAS domain S-box-containing protein
MTEVRGKAATSRARASSRRAFLSLGMAACLAWAAPARAEGPDERTLVVGSEEDYPPFALGRTPETADGFTVELWRAVAAEAGLRYTLRVDSFHEILAEFRDGKIDVLINLARSDERRKFASFTVPHVTVNGAIFVREGDERVGSEADLAGRSIVVIRSDLAHDYARSRGWESQLVLTDGAAGGLQMLSSGRHDAMLLSKLAGLQTLEASKIRNVVALDARPGFSQSFAFAVHKDDADLLARLNEALVVKKSDGTYDALHDRWFGIYEPHPPTLVARVPYLGAIGAILLGFAGYAVWRRRAERELRARGQRLRTLLASSPVAMFHANRSGGFDFTNERWQEILGLSLAESVGNGWTRAIDPRDRAAVETAWRSSAGAGAEIALELRVVRPDGEPRRVRLRARPLGGGGRAGFVGTVEDVTEQRRAEEERAATLDAIRASEHRYRTLSEHAPAGIFEADARGATVFVNERWTKLVGLSEEEALGDGWQRALHPEDRARVIEAWETARAAQQEYAVEHRFLGPSGERWVSTRAIPLLDPNGRLTGYLGSVLDLTELRRAQQRLALNEQLVSLGELAAGVAHEINNPLAYVVASLETARERVRDAHAAPPGDLDQLLSDATEGAARVAKIVRDLKTLSRASDDGRAEIDVRRALETSIHMATHAIRHKARLEETHGDLPLVLGDEARLAQVFINLLVNAGQAFADGNVERNVVRVVTRTDEQGRAVVEVSDNGPGIPPEVLGRVFDPFFTTKGIGGGTGLGLSICQGIVTSLGGEITAESAVGSGSSFRVALPPAPGAPIEDERAKVPPPTPSSALRRGRVLIVDDEPVVARSFGRILDRHEVTIARSARDALDRVAAGESFDVVLCDLMMPDVTGMHLHAELSRVAPAAAARMIFVTGGAFTPEAKAFLERVPNERLDKPVDPATLREAVARVLR